MGDVKITNPRVTVIRDGHEPLELQTDNRDMILWEKTRIKHRWPRFDASPMMWLTFLSWAAARRTGAIELGYAWEKWESETLQVSTIDEKKKGEGDADDDEAGRPFDEATEPDS